MDKATAAILLTLVAHLVGLAALVWLAFDGERRDWRSWWPGDGGGGDPPDDAPRGPGGPPLDDAAPAGRRVRSEHDRLSRDRARRGRHRARPAPSRTGSGS